MKSQFGTGPQLAFHFYMKILIYSLLICFLSSPVLAARGDNLYFEISNGAVPVNFIAKGRTSMGFVDGRSNLYFYVAEPDDNGKESKVVHITKLFPYEELLNVMGALETIGRQAPVVISWDANSVSNRKIILNKSSNMGLIGALIGGALGAVLGSVLDGIAQKENIIAEADLSHIKIRIGDGEQYRLDIFLNKVKNEMSYLRHPFGGRAQHSGEAAKRVAEVLWKSQASVKTCDSLLAR